MSDKQDKQELTWQGPTRCICPICFTINQILWPSTPLTSNIDIQCRQCNMISEYRIVTIEAWAAASTPPRAAWPTTHTPHDST